MRKYQYQIYYHTSRGRYFIKIRYSFLGLVFWLTLRDKYSSNIETFPDKDKAIERAEEIFIPKEKDVKGYWENRYYQ